MRSFAPAHAGAPLLEGEDAVRARAALEDIAAWLRGRAGAPAGLDARAASLAEGDAGIAVFFAALARSGFDSGAARDAERHLARAVDGVQTRVMSDSFFCGFPGVAWAVQHITWLDRPGAAPVAA